MKAGCVLKKEVLAVPFSAAHARVWQSAMTGAVVAANGELYLPIADALWGRIMRVLSDGLEESTRWIPGPV